MHAYIPAYIDRTFGGFAFPCRGVCMMLLHFSVVLLCCFLWSQESQIPASSSSRAAWTHTARVDVVSDLARQDNKISSRAGGGSAGREDGLKVSKLATGEGRQNKYSLCALAMVEQTKPGDPLRVQVVEPVDTYQVSIYQTVSIPSKKPSNSDFGGHTLNVQPGRRIFFFFFFLLLDFHG